MSKNKGNLKTMIEINDNIAQISTSVNYAKFMICSLLNDIETVKTDEEKLFIYDDIRTMANIAFDCFVVYT